MRWLRPILVLACVLALVSLLLVFAFHDDTRPFVDPIANHASVLGLAVSVVGFALTVWTILDTMRASREAILEAKKETKNLLLRIRGQLMGETCDQAFYFATGARQAVREGAWRRAAEQCQDARQLSARLLHFRELTPAERTAIRDLMEDLKTAVAFIEKNRLKDNPPAGLPADKLAPLDSLIDELGQIRSRLQQRLLEVPDVNGGTD
jgi:hypothetical protein